MSNYLLPFAAAVITVAASDKLATWGRGRYTVSKVVPFTNLPDSEEVVFRGSGANTTAAFTKATEVTLQAGEDGLYYATGTGPVVSAQGNLNSYQAAPGALNSTGTLTAALILGGIVTSSTAAAVTATLDTGEVMDAVLDLGVNDAFFWSAINTGGSNAFTVTAAATGHTIVGNGAVAANGSGRFLTRKTAANTFVTYRIS